MSSNNFSIPPEFSSQLRLIDPIDKRSDAEILASLKHHVPVTGEKNIWAFWDKGLDAMPGWCQRNVTGWVRICCQKSSSSDHEPWTVRVLDALPASPNYALRYLDASELPEAFVGGTMDGPYVGPHSADFLRGALLHRYGGAFMDVGNVLFRHLDRVGWTQLEDPDSPYRVVVPLMYKQVIANHFVMARKGDEFIERWHKLFVHFWQNRSNHRGIINDPLLKFAQEYDLSDSQSARFQWNMKMPPLEIFEYISQVLAWNRLCILQDPHDGFDGPEYWTKRVLAFDVLKEDWAAEETVGFVGEDIYAALCTPTDKDVDSPQWKKAYGLVWRMLTSATMQKVTHGKGITRDLSLGYLLDENSEADVAPGTFAEILRFGALHFEQTRNDIVWVETEKSDVLLNKGLLDP